MEDTGSLRGQSLEVSGETYGRLMVSLMVWVEPVVLGEEAYSQKYRDILSVENVARKNLTFSSVNGKDM